MQPFINRELSWLSFNERVLSEAERPETLPLEKLKFLAITASNLDEFFMIRVAFLHDCGKEGAADDAGLTPREQLDKVLEKTRALQLRQAACFQQVEAALREHNIAFLKPGELSEEQQSYVNERFEDEILPVLTPLAIDPSRPFPFLANQSLNIGVRMRDEHGKSRYAVVQAPSILPRFIPLPSSEGYAFISLEELIAQRLDSILNMHEIRAFGFFRITRCADFDADEDTDNLLEEMKRAIKKRKRGKPIRLELSEGFDERLRGFLLDMLGIAKKFVFELPGPLDLSALMKIASLKECDHLRPKPIAPAMPPDFSGHGDIFAVIREGDRLLHHPYESFDPVVDFVAEAARDPDVLAIKQTLYRVSGKSRVIAALEQAAEAGKQVTVLVELKARFDEENNIQWATRLERAGCHVIYGLTGLKTHSKITLVVRRELDGIRRYVHLATGNYNDVTARLYTDIGMFTCRPAFGADASGFFNHLTGFSEQPKYQKLIAAPENLKAFLLMRIDAEIDNAKRGLPCGICFKANSLLDSQVVRKLYDASAAGVPSKLLIRGICSLVPGVKGVSEQISVRSIVGQLLEHSRIYMFENAGDPLVYLSSADLMPRNLERRVELAFPVEDPLIKRRLLDSFTLMWQDNVCAWELRPDGEYARVGPGGEAVNSQLAFSVDGSARRGIIAYGGDTT